jgi:3-hydroxyacyl-CoA dehydrogenase/3a,7a,12a-trihydroxy-5b-cholest-24-enoyl-CoA hydratase
LLRTKITDGVTLENVRDNWQRVTSMEDAEHLNSIQEATGALMSSLESFRSGHAQKQENDVYDFTEKDAILYALGGKLLAFRSCCNLIISQCILVGASLKNKNELKFLYENHEDFAALPTFYILPAMRAIFTSSSLESAIPGKSISLAQVLHGEQYIEFLGNVPRDGKLMSTCSLVEVLDKGSGAAIVQDGMIEYNIVMFNCTGFCCIFY